MDRLRWLGNKSVPNWILVVVGVLSVVGLAVQVQQGWDASGDRAEQQRARLSLRIELQEIEDGDQVAEVVGSNTPFRIVAPLEIGGLTDARGVVFKHHVSTGAPKQRDVSSVDVDWSSREGHWIGDVSPTEVGRQVVTEPLSRQRVETMLSQEASLFIVARLEYCDVYGHCHYFMRCAEFGRYVGIVTLLRYAFGIAGGVTRRNEGWKRRSDKAAGRDVPGVGDRCTVGSGVRRLPD